MRNFGTRGPVNPQENYIVSRTEATADFSNRVKEGRYIVLFAPRQSGKTTFFQRALDTLPTASTEIAGADAEPTYFPIRLNFEEYEGYTPAAFYASFYREIRKEIEAVFRKRGSTLAEPLNQFLEKARITDHVEMREFFEHLAGFLDNQKVVLIIDEFDGIPQAAVTGFLHSLRHIYLPGKPRCPHSIGIIGVKSITQLSYDRSISPFNIQDEFHLSNFTLIQVQELLTQYTDEIGQTFAPEVIESLHKQTAGQPFLVNRFAQILTEELDIPKTEPITIGHFAEGHARLLRERNTNIDHLTTNIRKNRHFERILMEIMTYEEGVRFNLHDELISELATYGVIGEGPDGRCEILNPIYLHHIMQVFTPAVNGLERDYFAEENINGFLNYLTPAGQIEMEPLLDNFRDFITRTGFRILQVPETPQEYVGRHLLLTYLDSFVQTVGGIMSFEVPTGRGKMDLLITHNQRKYIVETKIWRGDARYQAGKKQLAAYLKIENVQEGYYVVFDHRKEPEPRVETDHLDSLTIRSYVIPVIQETPSHTLI